MDKEVDVINSELEVVNEYEVVFAKPYNFEGKSHEKIDLTNLNDITAKDMIDVDRTLQRNGSTSFLPEMTLEYTLQLAAKATKLPIEFFDCLPPREALRVKAIVTRFLFAQA